MHLVRHPGGHASGPAGDGMSGRRATVGLRLYALLYMLFLYLPMAMIPLFSLNDSIYVALPLKGLTLHWYRDLMGNAQLGTALRNSLLVGLAAATLPAFTETANVRINLATTQTAVTNFRAAECTFWRAGYAMQF